MSGWLENYEKEKVKLITERGKSFSEMYLYCPYCGYEQEEVYKGFDLTPNGEESEGQCQSCERHFFYSVELSFSTRRKSE